MSKYYGQYCPVAHALDLVGDRWALLIVRELMHGPKRYTDLNEVLPRMGTNSLAARLRDLESAGIVVKRKLPPPFASRVYELTEYGRGLRSTLRELALWGARSLGPPTAEDELFPGWLANALDIVLAEHAPTGRFEFRIGDEVASVVDGEAREGPADEPDVIVEGEPEGFFYLVVDGRLDLVTVKGDRGLLEQLLEAAAEQRGVPTPA
jgi:DNA-binding HxlR family transcriptional regulator